MTNGGVSGFPSPAVSLGQLDLRYRLGSADQLTSGQSTIDRRLATGTATMSTGTLRLGFFQSTKSETVNNLRLVSVGAAGATPTLVRGALYSVLSNGDLTLMGATTSDTSVFASPSTGYTRALNGGVYLTVGSWYAIGILVVTASSAPTVPMVQAATAAEMGFAPKLCVSVTGQSDLPATVATASMVASNALIYAVCTP